MRKNSKTINKFHRSHAGLRKFLRLVSYGCYHRNLFSRHAITPRSYDDLLRQIRFFVPEKNLQMTRHDKFSYFTFVGDFRHGTKNYFYSSFLLKTLLPEHCLQKIILLQILEGAGALPAIEILSRAEQVLTDHKPDCMEADLFQSFRRRLNELTDSGVLRKFEAGGKVLYEKISNPLDELSENELTLLHSALKFYRNVAPIGTAGYFLCDSLKTCTESAREIFQFRNNNFARILDDDLLLTIAKAIHLRKKILVERENKSPVTVTPVAVETDFLCSRQYLVALRQKELMSLRIEKIVSVKLLGDAGEKFSPSQKKLREVRLLVHFKDADERRLREKILTEELPARIVEEAQGVICVVETPDPLQIYPRLWKFQPWAEILAGKDGLRERMRRDVQEVLKNYAKSV
ncbi:MAG: WYL domain-containing protein [Selenomonadaceae bacterium]|nr:WYL domain-containing protein [Selenomonadaceae bacterium]